ncbi:MAG: ATP-binding protein [Clostridia bacterium]|nr:ATP-binding protein [Clostridia bacterium]
MTDMDLKGLGIQLSLLSVFRGILKTDTMSSLLKFLTVDVDLSLRTRLYGEFVYSLREDNYSFSDFLKRTVYADENKYVIGTAQGKKLPEALVSNAKAELSLFSSLTRLDADTLCKSLSYSGYIPRFSNTAVDFEKTYEERLSNIGKYGYGVFSSAKMFRVEGQDILPVEAADDISADSFVGYKQERQKVFDNTKALIDGKPAANVLLFGDAGTGKSSTVKACVNRFYGDGVRLIELRKDQLLSLSSIMDRIAENPLKFIIFIDDLSFNKNDDCFSMLKAALEGSASAKAHNAVIYATSNRRHIVKETFSDRATSDDIHHNDTVQELMSLSDRFGLTVYFGKPDKALYLQIVHSLARKNGIEIEQNELDIKAEAFALSKGSRSPRAAEQFINSLI